jgi:hypothetical protein
MGKASRAEGTAMSPDQDQLGQEQASPEELQAEIEKTREELGDTVEALAEKADVKAQAKARIESAKDAAQQKKETVSTTIKSATPESAAVGAQKVATTAKKNPVPLAAGGAFVVGFLIGRLSSR